MLYFFGCIICDATPLCVFLSYLYKLKRSYDSTLDDVANEILHSYSNEFITITRG